jgi:hypothetical protein
MKKRKARIGDLVEITWLDAKGTFNMPLSKATPAKAVNRGILVKEEDTFYVLQQGVYLDDGPDPDMDCTVIPKGWEQDIKILKYGPKKRKRR